MKKITLYQCKGCDKLFPKITPHDEEACMKQHKEEEQKDKEDLFMSSVYLQDDSEGPIGEWETIKEDRENVNVIEAEHEVVEKKDGEIVEFKTFEDVCGTIEVTYKRVPVKKKE